MLWCTEICIQGTVYIDYIDDFLKQKDRRFYVIYYRLIRDTRAAEVYGGSVIVSVFCIYDAPGEGFGAASGSAGLIFEERRLF